MTKAELTALAAAARVPVTRVPEGHTSLGLTDREWHAKVRDPKPQQAETRLEWNHYAQAYIRRNAEGEV